MLLSVPSDEKSLIFFLNILDAVESLLMLGRQPVVSTERQRAASTSSSMPASEEARSLLRRHSSGSSDASSVRSSDNKVVSYYQVRNTTRFLLLPKKYLKMHLRKEYPHFPFY